MNPIENPDSRNNLNIPQSHSQWFYHLEINKQTCKRPTASPTKIKKTQKIITEKTLKNMEHTKNIPNKKSNINIPIKKHTHRSHMIFLKINITNHTWTTYKQHQKKRKLKNPKSKSHITNLNEHPHKNQRKSPVHEIANKFKWIKPPNNLKKQTDNLKKKPMVF